MQLTSLYQTTLDECIEKQRKNLTNTKVEKALDILEVVGRAVTWFLSFGVLEFKGYSQLQDERKTLEKLDSKLNLEEGFVSKLKLSAKESESFVDKVSSKDESASVTPGK